MSILTQEQIDEITLMGLDPNDPDVIELYRAPTPEELVAIREASYRAVHPASFVFDEDTLSWVAPVSPPDNENPYMWDEATTSWVVYNPDPKANTNS